MKKQLSILLVAFTMTSCYEDYVKDYDYSGIYFANQINTRSIVVGEKMNIEVGAVLAGVMENNKNRTVNFEFDNSLVNEETLKSMKSSSSKYIKEAVNGVTELKCIPDEYFTISNPDAIVIPKGDHLGKVTVTLNDKFLTDPLAIKANYVLPLRITNADADRIVESKETTVIGFKYEGMLFGNYYHGGCAEVKDADGNIVKKENYFTIIPQEDNQIWTLTTVAPYTVVTNKIGNGRNGNMKITLNSDGTVDLSSDNASLNLAENGECIYNQAKLLQDRKIFLKYKFDNGDGTISFATDTLTFRNRIRDGVNEWQDENPDNYKK